MELARCIYYLEQPTEHKPFKLQKTLFDSRQLEMFMPRWMKLIAWLFVVGPRLFIAVFLFFAGTIWLTTARSFEAILMNSLALEFIVTIDETIFECGVPQTYQRL